MIPTAAIVGIVLCGGRSRRMGQDKNFVTWNGTTLLQHVVTAMEQVCTHLVLIKADLKQALPTLETKLPLRMLVDEDPHAGPAAALRVGFEEVRRSISDHQAQEVVGTTGSSKNVPVVLLVGNDSPLLQPALLRYLVERLRSQEECDAVVPCLGTPPRDCFPLHAAYRLETSESLVLYHEQGERSLKGWLDRLRVDWVSETDLRLSDPDLGSLVNLNCPADIQGLRSYNQ